MYSVRRLLSVFVFVCATIRPSHQGFGPPDFLTWGDCANVTLQKDMDSEKYSGLWFDIESVPNEYQYVKKCLIQSYIWTGEHMLVESRGLSNSSEKIRQEASMHIERENNDPAHMIVTSDDVPEAPYQIIDTDYHNYACVYSCTMFVGFKAEFTWVYGRAPVLAQEFVDRCHSKFREMDVDPSSMKKIIQGDMCPYWHKLPKLLENSKAQLSENMGPDGLATDSSPSNTIDQMQETIEEESDCTGTAVQGLIKQTGITKTSSGSKATLDLEASHADAQEQNKGSQLISYAHFLNVLITGFLVILTK